MLKYGLPRVYYWMKVLYVVYPFSLNEANKFMDNDSPIERPFPPLLKVKVLLTVEHGQK